jgi:hypothetical protein
MRTLHSVGRDENAHRSLLVPRPECPFLPVLSISVNGAASASSRANVDLPELGGAQRVIAGKPPK